MLRTGCLTIAIVFAVLPGIALADPPIDSTIEARLRALEKRVSDLEQNRSPDAPAAPPSKLEQRISNLEKKSDAPAAAGARPAVPAGPLPSKDHANWAKLRTGMTWSQVKAILGVPGKVKAGVFGDVMYFPDDNGGSVEFDRDGRVSTWSETAKP